MHTFNYLIRICMDWKYSPLDGINSKVKLAFERIREQSSSSYLMLWLRILRNFISQLINGEELISEIFSYLLSSLPISLVCVYFFKNVNISFCVIANSIVWIHYWLWQRWQHYPSPALAGDNRVYVTKKKTSTLRSCYYMPVLVMTLAAKKSASHKGELDQSEVLWDSAPGCGQRGKEEACSSNFGTRVSRGYEICFFVY